MQYNRNHHNHTKYRTKFYTSSIIIQYFDTEIHRRFALKSVVIKGFFDPAEKKMSDLPQCYKDYISDLSCPELEAFIKEINTYAKLYQDNFEEIDSEALYCYDTEQYLSRIMHIVDVLEISTFLPYILYLLFEKDQNPQNDVKERFLALERYLILHAICGETTKNYNKECLQLILIHC